MGPPSAFPVPKNVAPSGVPEEATMDWMSGVFVTVLILLAAEGMGALFTRR